MNLLGINGVSRTLTERQEVNGIQQIRLAHAVLPEETVQFTGEVQVHFFQILVIEYGYTF
jgi:hypothetical protein